MIRLFPPQQELELYTQGFGDSDLLGRGAIGKRLSELLERVVEPVVVAVDGPWGSGKSHFLQRWVGAHRLENEGRATTVYFDAFAHDYLEDPLIAITGAISERLPSEDERGTWKAAKKLAFTLSLPTLRMGLAAATSGLTELAGPLVDAMIETGSKDLEAAAEEFWRREDGRRAAMASFRSCLSRLTAPSTEGADDAKPLIIVIDELDRCRPDYALAVLEVMKHFFAVPRVHFVLGTNIRALEHSVRARYGAGIDASEYLKRFISLVMQLPDNVPGSQGETAVMSYFKASAASMGIDTRLVGRVHEHLEILAPAQVLTLRDVEKVLTGCALVPPQADFSNRADDVRTLVAGLLVIRFVDRELFSRINRGAASIEDLLQFYRASPQMLDEQFEARKRMDQLTKDTLRLWHFLLSNGASVEPGDHRYAPLQRVLEGPHAQPYLTRFIDKYFFVFDMMARN